MQKGMRLCNGCGTHRHKSTFERDRCRACRGVPAPGTERPGTLAAMSDDQASDLYESLLARVRSGEMRHHDPRWIDVCDEMEIRARDRVMVVGNLVYSWDHEGDELRRRFVKPPVRRSGSNLTRGDVGDRRVHRTPVGLMVPGSLEDLEIAV